MKTSVRSSTTVPASDRPPDISSSGAMRYVVRVVSTSFVSSTLTSLEAWG